MRREINYDRTLMGILNDAVSRLPGFMAPSWSVSLVLISFQRLDPYHSKVITSPGTILRVSAAGISPRTLQAVSGEVRILTGEFWNPEPRPNGTLPARGGPPQAGGRIAGIVISKFLMTAFHTQLTQRSTHRHWYLGQHH